VDNLLTQKQKNDAKRREMLLPAEISLFRKLSQVESACCTELPDLQHGCFASAVDVAERDCPGASGPELPDRSPKISNVIEKFFVK
jgi:hypothetical protein